MQKNSKHSIDIYLLITVIALVLIGLVMVFSASSIVAGERFGNPFFFLKRHIIWLLIGFSAMSAAALFDYSKWHKISFFLVFASICLLTLVLVPGIGIQAGGARRWFRFGFIGFQPSELAKLAMIIYTASWLDRKQSKISRGFSVYIPKALIIAVIVSLIYLEPDLGTSVLLFCVLVTMHFIGGLPYKYLVTIFFMSIPGIYYGIFNSAYRRRRLFSFLNPWADAKGSGYQIIQSLLALGTGGITGVGLGNSKLKLMYLPEAHTDFIYPIIAEELGIIGSIGVIILFAYLCYRGVMISLYSKDFFGKILAFGITVLITYQAIINIAVTTGMLPTKGMTLPFISFGGSSLVITLFAVGILLNISKYTETKRREIFQ
ncbi:putative lipid II flippase FtsW [bacterium]